jgi:CRISPR-associated endoribonuclease Cas6
MEIIYEIFGFTIVPSEPLHLPLFKGSTIRGGFGNVFRKVVCALKKNDCHDCILKEKCIYAYVFETIPPSDTKYMKKYPSAPHPFVIEPPLEEKTVYNSKEDIVFNLILIGRAIDYLPYFIYTFDELGKIGIGRQRGKYKLKEVWAENERIYNSDGSIKKVTEQSSITISFDYDQMDNPNEEILIRFITPTRIVFNGHLTIDLEFHILIRNLLRRIALLSYFHCSGDPDGIDFKRIIAEASKVRVVERDLVWHDWERYSFRKKMRMKLGGFVGSVKFTGNIRPFMPLLKAGEVVHVGRATAFGLGKYEIC